MTFIVRVTPATCGRRFIQTTVSVHVAHYFITMKHVLMKEKRFRNEIKELFRKSKIYLEYISDYFMNEICN